MTENTIRQPSEFDALEKAREDELIFTLLERDPCAPDTIMHWCDLRRKNVIDLDDKEKRQISQAEQIAIEMKARQRGEDKAEVEGGKPLYSGVVHAPDEDAALMGKIRSELAEADFRATNAVERMQAALGADLIDEESLALVRNAAIAIHDTVLKLSPHRAALTKGSESA